MSIDEIIEKALAEDIGEGDHTSLACIPQRNLGRAKLMIKDTGILCGVDLAKDIFKKVDSDLNINILLKDGQPIKSGDIALTVEGTSISIVTAERTVLNFMQRMSGIATFTHLLASQLTGLKTKILDTRKTTPTLRILEKYAVKTGGGTNHRFGLYDMILIKDNHIDFAGGIENAILATTNYLSKKNLQLKIEIEARTLDELNKILRTGGIHRILLDNFSYSDLEEAVKRINGKYETEASGNINLGNIRKYAECDVDFVSVGALTHQIKSLDMSLKAY